MQIRQKRCTIGTSKARASERQLKRKNTRAPCRIRREGITCRGVVPFAFRRRRDVLFFSFFLKKTRRGSGRLVFLFFRNKARPPTLIAANSPAICRGRACPARSLPPNPFHGQSVGEGFIPPGHFPPSQTATAARGLAALRMTRKGLLSCGASRTPPPTIIAINLPVVCRGRIYAARQPAGISCFPVAAL